MTHIQIPFVVVMVVAEGAAQGVRLLVYLRLRLPSGILDGISPEDLNLFIALVLPHGTPLALSE